MKITDVFSGLQWGNLNRYKARHNATVNRESAEDRDKRILEMLARPHNYKWAVEAVAFCDREANAPREVLRLSAQNHLLQEIRGIAQELIRQEKQRVDQLNREKAQQVDEAIFALSNGDRNRRWCADVANQDRQVTALHQDVRALLKNQKLLAGLVKEAGLLTQALNAEDAIRKLLNKPTKDAAWMREAEKYVNASPRDPVMNAIPDQSLRDRLKEAYLLAQRTPDINRYTDILQRIEKDGWSKPLNRQTFNAADAQLRALGYSMELYINNFTARWAAAKGLVAEEEQRIEAERKARLEEMKRQAEHAKNVETLESYISLIREIETDPTGLDALKEKYNELDWKRKGFTFDPDSIHAGFTQQWEAAGATLDRLREEEAACRRRLEEEIANRKRMKIVWAAVRMVLIIGACLASAAASVIYLTGYEVWWYVPMAIGLSAVAYIQLANVDETDMYLWPHVVAQVLFYVALVLFAVFLEAPIFEMILAAVLVLLAFNVYPYEREEFDNDVPGWIGTLVTTVCTLALAFLLPITLEMWIYGWLAESVWHSLWLTALVIAGIFALSVGMYWDGDGPGERLFFVLFTGTAQAVLALFHMLGQVFAVLPTYEISIDFFGFVYEQTGTDYTVLVLQLIVGVVAGLVSLGAVFFVADEI